MIAKLANKANMNQVVTSTPEPVPTPPVLRVLSFSDAHIHRQRNGHARRGAYRACRSKCQMVGDRVFGSCYEV